MGRFLHGMRVELMMKRVFGAKSSGSLESGDNRSNLGKGDLIFI